MTDAVNPSRRGGKRSGAGRPKLRETTTIRIPVSMLKSVKAMIAAIDSGHQIEFRIVGKL